VPSGTPTTPPTMNGKTRGHEMACQIAGRVMNWEISEQMTTRGAATAGSITVSQTASAVNPVPKPVSPDTKPPASAPARMVSSNGPIDFP